MKVPPRPGSLSPSTLPPWNSHICSPWKAQADALVFAPGAVRLPEALPDILLILVRDADAVVPDGEGTAFPALLFQPQPDVSVLLAVLVGVLQKILYDPGHESEIEFRHYPALCPGGQGYPSGVRQDKFAAAGIHEGAQVRLFMCMRSVPCSSLLWTKLRYHVGHLAALLFNDGIAWSKSSLFFASSLALAHLASITVVGVRQLVGGVGYELLFRFEGVLQSPNMASKVSASFRISCGPWSGHPGCEVVAAGYGRRLFVISPWA